MRRKEISIHLFLRARFTCTERNYIVYLSNQNQINAGEHGGLSLRRAGAASTRQPRALGSRLRHRKILARIIKLMKNINFVCLNGSRTALCSRLSVSSIFLPRVCHSTTENLMWAICTHNFPIEALKQILSFLSSSPRSLARRFPASPRNRFNYIDVALAVFAYRSLAIFRGNHFNDVFIRFRSVLR